MRHFVIFGRWGNDLLVEAVTSDRDRANELAYSISRTHNISCHVVAFEDGVPAEHYEEE